MNHQLRWGNISVLRTMQRAHHTMPLGFAHSLHINRSFTGAVTSRPWYLQQQHKNVEEEDCRVEPGRLAAPSP